MTRATLIKSIAAQCAMEGLILFGLRNLRTHLAYLDLRRLKGALNLVKLEEIGLGKVVK